MPRHDQVGVARDEDDAGRRRDRAPRGRRARRSARRDRRRSRRRSRSPCRPTMPDGICADLVRLLADDDRVPGVRAALVAADEVGVLGEQVDDLALALVAPLRADDHGRRHVGQSCRRPASALAPRRRSACTTGDELAARQRLTGPPYGGNTETAPKTSSAPESSDRRRFPMSTTTVPTARSVSAAAWPS